MDNKEQGIFRTFTFRNFSPSGVSNNNLKKLSLVNKEESLLSESSELSYQKPSENSTVFSPKNPEKILETLIKQFKIHRSISSTLVEGLPFATCKSIVERLINEKLTLQDELSIKKEESLSEEISELSHPGDISPGTKKMQAFRALANVSPIEIDNSDVQTNYKIISLALTPHEDLRPNHLLSKSKKFEDYKREVLKLGNELKELASYNQILTLIISLDKDNESSQLINQLKEKIKIYEELSISIAENLKKLKNTLEPSEGFLESVHIQRQEIKVLGKMIGFDKSCDLKPSEMQTVNRLLDLSLEDPKKFEIFIDEVLGGHDIAEVSIILVKYIKFLEETAKLDLKAEALNCLITEIRNELKIEESIDKGLSLSKQLRVLNSKIGRADYKKCKNMRSEQLKIRDNRPLSEKAKWKLPQNLQGLDGAELYSKTLAQLKKK